MTDIKEDLKIPDEYWKDFTIKVIDSIKNVPDAEKIKTGAEYWLGITRESLEGTLYRTPDGSRSGGLGLNRVCEALANDETLNPYIQNLPDYEELLAEWDGNVQETLEMIMQNGFARKE
ncbi:MAG: hypothetical protein LW855_04215 [Alphaproteobacteria bacterium]|nr:hypothetical protein [Thalassospira sp.]MCE2964974.1 hypothetical protein [Alphaproteobacteria bacterium]